MISSRLLQRMQPCMRIGSNIRTKSTKSNILKKASMALGKQNKKESIQRNVNLLKRREPVLKVTTASTYSSATPPSPSPSPSPSPPEPSVYYDEIQPVASAETPVTGGSPIPASPIMEEAQIPVQAPMDHAVPTPTPPAAPVVEEPSAFSRTQFHQGHLHEFAPRIVVVGVGGGGGNAVNNMIANQLSGVDFLALNTDAQHLSTTLTENRLQIGTNLTSGLGCGANPDAGRLAAEESREEITELLGDAHMVFVTAGMGGGTGTGAAPVVAEICYNLGILTVGVVTKPFRFEGTHRMRLANEGVGRLKEVVDTLIMIPNQNLFHLANDNTSFMDSFAMADNVLLAGVRSITDLMTTPGLINLDFADVQSVMHGMGNAMLGTGVASKDGLKDNEERALLAAEQALANPLLGENMDIGTAKGMLVNITGGKDMTLFEVDRAAQHITERVLDENANIIFGSAYDESLDGSIRVSVVATGIDDKATGN